MIDLSDFQQRAVAVAVVRLLHGKHFNICDLDALGKTLGREQAMSGRDYSALRGLHCVDWSDMGPELSRMTRGKCLELLGLPEQTIDMVQPYTPAEKPREPAKKPLLSFWRA